MALDRPESGFIWLHVPPGAPIECVVNGSIETWWAHFVRQPGARKVIAVRCFKGDMVTCPWCEGQVGVRARYVVPVLVDGAQRLVELGRVQYGSLRMLSESVGGEVGKRIRLSHEWNAKNAPIVVLPLGREVITAEMVVDVREFVDTLGRAERGVASALGLRPSGVVGSSDSRNGSGSKR